MKILLIIPDAHMHCMGWGPFKRSMREAPLTLTTLAALVPDRDIAWRLVDGSIDPIPRSAAADLVGISVITGNALAAYELADHYRRRGIPVVLGGVHVTLRPDEAAPHADSVVVGMAERSWPRLIHDFRHGNLAARYEDPSPPSEVLAGIPVARRDLLRRGGYMMPHTVQATRGCRRACDFCCVPALWPRYQRRPVGEVMADIRSLPGRYFCFNDVSLTDDVGYARELVSALIPLRKRWGGLTTVDVVRHPDLLELMQRSGCAYLLLGFESVTPAGLQAVHKGFNQAIDYAEAMRALHAHGISVQGCFVFGLDSDDRDSFRATVERVLDLGVDIPRYSICTPYPGTALFERLYRERRILSTNWNDYDTMHVVFQPRQMSPTELYAGFKWAYRETFRFRHIRRRWRGIGLNTTVNLTGNVVYARFARRLERDPRFARPYTMDDPRLPEGYSPCT